MTAAAELRQRAAAIRLLVLDVDGVLTDGRLFFSDDGSETKTFHCRDGFGMRQLLDHGVAIAIISGRNSPAVDRRMAELGVERVYQGCRDKIARFDSLLEELGISAGNVAVMGDDVPDLPPMLRAGLAVAVADAHADVRSQAHWTTTAPGGHGAVRELADLLLAARAEAAQ